MPGIRQDLQVNGTPIVRLESAHLQVDVAPGVGGRVISIINKANGYEFLWRNSSLPLELKPSGTEYDPNFYGGIDELLPNDMPEVIDGVACPDHGELWTTALSWHCDGARSADSLVRANNTRLKFEGTLPRFGLKYERDMSLRADSPSLDCAYRITNVSAQPRHFLWKLHAALAVQAGDVIDCPARTGQVVDPNWSRYKALEAFAWPTIEGQAANVIPAADGTVDFFYLFDLTEGQIAWRRPIQGLKFAYHFDPRVFPCAWLFASYGGFNGHYTVVLEPCTAMPISVNEAAKRKQCSLLQPGESLETQVTIRAGPEKSQSRAGVSPAPTTQARPALQNPLPNSF
ncbi:MAG: hypothetical protein C5B50_26620 [Verrucomicrobia bacterium]|nr:MAG: hypothetical protein C5B50_26620 [Verrucomicrobiota bacterium]